MEVSAFTAQARQEFMRGKMAADEKPVPAKTEQFTTVLPSTVKVETHTFMSNLPRLEEFKGYTPFVSLVDKTYTVANKEYRTGLRVRKTDVQDDQVGGYMLTVNGLTARAKKDIEHIKLAHLAAGTTNLCFDGTAMFAASHTIGTGDNLDTFDGGAQDGATHKIIALITDNSAIKPVIFQDREPLSELQTDADTPQAAKTKEYEYFVDSRFGLGYGYWWDSIHLTITDTPTVAECYTIVEQIVNLFRTFTLPKGKDTNDSLYIHEGWDPNPQNFVLCTNLKLGIILRRALSISQYIASTGNVDNVYQNVATVVPTSALGA
jgi:phage major head subunit gpT-like protein